MVGLASPEIACVIIDFANTLSNSAYFWPLGAEFCSIVTERIFTGDNKALWASPWCCGRISSEEVADHLATVSGLTRAEVLQGLNDGCANMKLNPVIWGFAQAQRSQGRRTVLATVNMDVFTRIVAPAHGFDIVFDVIVSSADYGTEDKNELCEIAFSQLEGCTFGNSLLIDDSAKVVEAFRKRGGRAYHYTSDEALAELLGAASTSRR